jgi:histidyl-tRNA synthetase
VGIEAIGVDDPALDAEVIAVADEGYKALGLSGYRLELTSLGDAESRPAYRERLQEFLAGLPLDEPTRERARINPLRVLDDKRPDVRALLVDAPLLVDHLSPAAAEHHAQVLAHLDDRHRVRGEPADGPQPRLLHEDGVRVRARRLAPSPGSARRADGLMATPGGPPLTARVLESAWTARCWHAARKDRAVVGGALRGDGVPPGDAARRRLVALAGRCAGRGAGRPWPTAAGG